MHADLSLAIFLLGLAVTEYAMGGHRQWDSFGHQWQAVSTDSIESRRFISTRRRPFILAVAIFLLISLLLLFCLPLYSAMLIAITYICVTVVRQVVYPLWRKIEQFQRLRGVRNPTIPLSYGVTVLLNMALILLLWFIIRAPVESILYHLLHGLSNVEMKLARGLYLVAGLIFCTRPATIVVQHILLPLRFGDPTELLSGINSGPAEVATAEVAAASDQSSTPLSSSTYSMASLDRFGWVPNNGSIIGHLERSLAFFLIFYQQYAALGFVLAAKSIARMKKLEDEQFAEYYLIGTLGSMAIALFLGFIGNQWFPG